MEQKQNKNWKLKQKRKPPDKGSSKNSLILEKARLNCINHTENATNKIPGPFSSKSGAQSLLNHFSNNSTFLKKKLSSVTCSVCGAIQVFRHARHVRNAYHFQVNTCNFCKLFLRKMIQISRSSSVQSLSCSKDNGKTFLELKLLKPFFKMPFKKKLNIIVPITSLGLSENQFFRLM